MQRQSEDIENYDESLVRKMIEKVTVYEDKFNVEFKAGISLDIVRWEAIIKKSGWVT